MGAVEESSTSGMREFTGENTLRRKTLCFFLGDVAPGVAKVGSLFPRFCASIKKRRGLQTEFDLHFKTLNISGGVALLEDEVGKNAHAGL